MLADISTSSIVLAIAMGLFTAVAAVWDHRYMRIPNKLTLPVFALGWVYQAAFHGWGGLLNGFGGFVVGFGLLFLLWMIGGGGGGDVKLMGAISVWLGYRMTLALVAVSTVLVVVLTFGAVLYQIATRGMRKTRDEYLATGKAKPTIKESIEKKQGRRVMAYALPVCLATWMVLGWFLPRMGREARAAEAKNAAAAQVEQKAAEPKVETKTEQPTADAAAETKTDATVAPAQTPAVTPPTPNNSQEEAPAASDAAGK
jgi:prepilin peptidase CpaA